VPLVLISDFLSVTVPNYFSVVLGLVLLAIVFFVPNGLIGLLQAARTRAQDHSLPDLLEAWAARLRRRSPGAAAKAESEPRTRQNGPDPDATSIAGVPVEDRQAPQ
jgi:hypothetical protein